MIHLTIRECKQSLNEVKELINNIVPENKIKTVFERIGQMERIYESGLFAEYK